MPLFQRHPASPLLGSEASGQTYFDCCVAPVGDGLRMWLSWRDRHALADADSADGVNWTGPRPVLVAEPSHPWEQDAVNRPHALRVEDRWYLWYTGQNFAAQTSALGLAVSADGRHWERASAAPVLVAEAPWEKQAVMCPHVLHEGGRFRMWYSAGEMYEPDAIGYAESTDGLHWERHPDNPVFRPGEGWEAARVTAACIVPWEGEYLAFYIGFGEGFESAQIGLARSTDGVSGWVRYPVNPILGPGPAGAWDDCNVYKPYVLCQEGRWRLWYNASRASDRREQIGLAEADDLRL